MFKNRAVALALSAKSHDIANLTKLSNQENENRKTVHTRRRGGVQKQPLEKQNTRFETKQTSKQGTQQSTEQQQNRKEKHTHKHKCMTNI